MEIIIANKYKVLELLGEGAFGKVFKSLNINTHEEVAIKIGYSDGEALIKNEARIINQLKLIKGVPTLRYYGVENTYHYLVMDILGKSLEDIRLMSDGTIKLKEVISIGIKVIDLLENIHMQGIVHRDVKPENILFDKDNSSLIYIIDYGLSKYFKINNNYITCEYDKNLVGTSLYASLNVHNGITATPRDDLESLGYVLLYLYQGSLPWQNVEFSTKKEKYKKTIIMKKNIFTHYINSKIKIPMEFLLIIDYSRNLLYEDIPNYKYLKNLLNNLNNIITLN